MTASSVTGYLRGDGGHQDAASQHLTLGCVTHPGNVAAKGTTATGRYTVAVSNTGTADATDLVLDSTLDPNTTLVPGSVQISPLAFADSYSVLKNTPRSVPAPGVLANDTGSRPMTVSPATDAPTAAGGKVTIASDGGFTYTPPADYTGADSFSYSVSNALGGEGFGHFPYGPLLLGELELRGTGIDVGVHGSFADVFRLFASANLAQ